MSLFCAICIAQTIRLEILHQSSLQISALDVTTMKDEMFVLWSEGCQYSVNVYDRNNVQAVKDVIPLPGRIPLNLTACSVSNCVYLLNRRQRFEVSVLRIVKGDDHQFNVSALITVPWLPHPSLSVTTTGNFILSRQREGCRAAVSIYNANGSLQHEVTLTSEIYRLSQIIPKPNGNLVLVSYEKCQYKTKLTEVDLHGTVLRQYLPPVCCHMIVSRVDIHGRLMMTDRQQRGTVLLDSQFSPLDFTPPNLDAQYQIYPYDEILFHYDSERKEIISFLMLQVLREVL